MSALAAIVAPDAETRVRAMLAAMRSIGGDLAEVHDAVSSGASIALATAAHGWERELGGSATSIATRGPLVCATDSRLYHRDDLRRSLGATGSSPATDAELILAVYEAWDVEGFARLEGDFAFAIWDGARGRLVAAIDQL